MLLSVPGSWPISISSPFFQRHPLICATENKPDQIKTFFVVRKAVSVPVCHNLFITVS